MKYINTFKNSAKRTLIFIQSNKIKIIEFYVIILGLLLLTQLLSTHDNKPKNKTNPGIVIISTKNIVSDFTNSLSKNSSLSDDQKIMLVKKFDTIYPIVLESYANKNNVLILDQDLAIQAPNSIKNITPDIENQIQTLSIKVLSEQKEQEKQKTQQSQQIQAPTILSNDEIRIDNSEKLSNENK